MSWIPDLDIRTWMILGLVALLLALILSVPPLRENIATWLIWLGTLLGAGSQEAYQREKRRREPDPVDSEPERQDYQREPIDPTRPQTDEYDQVRPSTDEYDTQYWQSQADDAQEE